MLYDRDIMLRPKLKVGMVTSSEVVEVAELPWER